MTQTPHSLVDLPKSITFAQYAESAFTHAESENDDLALSVKIGIGWALLALAEAIKER